MNPSRTGNASQPLLPVERRQTDRMTPSDVKLCELCGTLNLDCNKECWTCGWHGCFSTDAPTIALAWQRLESQYEEVRPEHVTARRARAIGDFGTPRPASAPQRILAGLQSWWQRFQDGRDLRMAQRHARLHSRMPSPPDQLGV